MGEFLAGVAVTLFFGFIYKKVKDSKDKKSGGNGSGGGRGRPGDPPRDLR